MINRDCPAFDEITEIQHKTVGSTSKGPIVIEKEIVVDQYCSFKSTNFFDCKDCEIYKKLNNNS